MSIDTASDSRFAITEPIIWNGSETFGLWKKFNFLTRELDAESEVKKLFIGSDIAGRPDLISNVIYGSPRFYWVLIMYNQPKNPIGWPRTGEIIKYPIRSVVVANF